jgi:benzylsuccinate CoA-transferase BbsF subunit
MAYSALEGVRIVDLGIVTAGASTSAVLADLGAEVLKVEGPSYTDPFREWTSVNEDTEWWNDSPQFQATNRNKRSVCLDLKSGQGRSLFLKLVAQSDIVLENFRTGVLKRLGIDFDELVKANARIILASISSQGQTGPEWMKSSFGSTLEASSGMSALMRYEGGTPQITGKGMNYPDQVAALFSAGAIMAALVERDQTGQAIALDLSQRELTSFLVGEELIAANARQNAGGQAAPATLRPIFAYDTVLHAADGQWIALSVMNPDILSTVDGLDGTGIEAIEKWAASLPASVAASRLRDAGAAAEVLWTAVGFDDPSAIRPETSFARDTQGYQVKGLPLRLGGVSIGDFLAAPPLGRDNEDVANTIMRLSKDEYGELVRTGIFSDRPSKAGPGAKKT